MKAAVFYGFGKVKVEDVPIPKISPEDILLKVKACGVCGSDLHTYKREIEVGSARRLGHEFGGEVVEVGESVKKLKRGDRASALLRARFCNQCHWCQKGQYNLCSNTTKGLYIPDELPGAFADYIRIPIADQTAFELPDEISFEEAVIIEPLTVAFHGVMRAKPEPEDAVLILGAGTIGLCAAQICKLLVSKTIVTEVAKPRLDMARTLGLIALDARDDDVDRKILDLFEGLGPDTTVECAGVPATLQQAVRLTRKGGKIVQLALYEEPAGYEPNQIVTKELTVCGASAYILEVKKTLELIKKGDVKARPLITHEYPLERIKEAFEISMRAQSIKVIVKP